MQSKGGNLLCLIAIGITVAVLLLKPVEATIVTWNFEGDIAGADPSGWTVYEDPLTNVEVYDDAGNKRCFLNDSNTDNFALCYMSREFSSSMITEDLNLTFDVKIDRNTSCFFSADLMGRTEVGDPICEVSVVFLNGSICAWARGDPTYNYLSDYTTNTWITITLLVFDLNRTYMLTDGTNTIWGNLNSSYAGVNALMFTTDPGDSDLTQNMCVNASVDNIIIKWNEFPETPPQVETLNATLVYQNGATLNGNLIDMGNATLVEVGFQFATSPGQYTDYWKVDNLSSPGTFQCSVGGLDEKTTYYFRAYAKDLSNNITVYGEEKNFTTLPQDNGCHLDQECYDVLQYYGGYKVTKESWARQSFIPTLSILSKIAVYINKSSIDPDEPLQISIASSNPLNILRTTSVYPDVLYTYYTFYEWDFEDLLVTPGEEYYIILESNCDTSFDRGYYWGGTNNDIYTNGSFYYDTSISNPVLEDAFFKVYGLSNLTASFTYSINNMTITVNASNSSSDPGTIIYYQWDWDGNGWYEDEGITATHTYSQNGTYNVTLRIVNNYNEWITTYAIINISEGINTTGSASTNSSSITSGDNVEDNGGGDTPKNIFKLPFSWFAIFLMAFVGIVGFSLGAFFLKPESIKALGYAPAAGSILSTIFILTTILLYHANVAWYWTVLSILATIFVIYVTVKTVLSSKKRRRVAKSIFRW